MSLPMKRLLLFIVICLPLLASTQSTKGKAVLLDRYFNSEKRKDAGGTMNYWHYTWEEKSQPGFYTLGQIFSEYGAKLASLDIAPSADALQKASVYIIVDPDHTKDNPTPNYVLDKDVKVITEWVEKGGVLLLMANDSANCDLQHFNKLANAFGITFTNKSGNMVQRDEYETGVVIPGDKTIFMKPYRMFLKDVSILNIKSPAKAVGTKNGEVIMARAAYGKGRVFAVGDPWLYNEYIDGKKLPAEYPNFKAGEDLVKWLLNNATSVK
jgi:unsaturated rhamnogalacturonyl hydrolase